MRDARTVKDGETAISTACARRNDGYEIKSPVFIELWTDKNMKICEADSGFKNLSTRFHLSTGEARTSFKFEAVFWLRKHGWFRAFSLSKRPAFCARAR